MKQSKTATHWVDEKGTKIPFKYIPKVERLMEEKAHSLLVRAQKAQSQLVEMKEEIDRICQEVFEAYMASKDVKAVNKGNFTWYNFDRSIKIEMAVSSRIEFDEAGITACKAVLEEFLNDKITSSEEYIKEMVLDAFSTSRGKLDAKKVMSLLRYEGKIKHELFGKAMNLIKDSIRRPDSKKYFRIWERDDNGQYQNVELNFSNI